MHIIYIITKLELGGAQKVCLSLYNGIKGLGGNSSLVSGSQGILTSDVLEDTGSPGNDIYLIDNFVREVKFLSEIKAFFRIIKYLRKMKKKHLKLVVHTHSTKAGIIGRWAAFFAGIKKRVHTVHGFGFNDQQPMLTWFVIYTLEAITSLITTHYVCVSSLDLDTGCRILPTFKSKCSIIRAAVEWEKFYTPVVKTEPFNTDQSGTDKSGNEKTYVFGTVSCFKPQKNLLDLLKAFKKVLNKNNRVKLQIIGDGLMRKDLELYITKNNMKNNVELLGWQRDVSSWMKSWDVYVMSSLWEGLPCSIVEARLLKLPVIAYNVGGISDVISDGENGFLIKPKSVNELAKKMILIIGDFEMLQKMSSHKEELFEFKNEFMVREHFDLYSRLF